MPGNRAADNRYFKMGAAVAIGELHGMGRLGLSAESARETRAYLASFGLATLDDIRAIGIKGPYLRDFESLYEAPRLATMGE